MSSYETSTKVEIVIETLLEERKLVAEHIFQRRVTELCKEYNINEDHVRKVAGWN